MFLNIAVQSYKLKLPIGNKLFWFKETFFINQVASSKVLGAMVTKMVATRRVAVVAVLLGSQLYQR